MTQLLVLLQPLWEPSPLELAQSSELASANKYLRPSEASFVVLRAQIKK